MGTIYKSGIPYSGGGPSLPSGGDTGQVLAKKSNLDEDVEWIDPPEGVVDTEMSDSSTNSVQNKVIKGYVDTGLTNKVDKTDVYTKTETDTLLDEKQDVLTADHGIKIENNIISGTKVDVSKGSTNIIEIEGYNSSKLGFEFGDDITLTASSPMIFGENRTLQEKLTAGDNITIEDNTISTDDEVFVATYERTSYADVKAAIDANKVIMLKMTANKNQFCMTYSTYTNGGNALMYAIYKMNDRLTFITATLTPTDNWTISHTDLQDKLVSGTNIKTVNGASLLGAGDVEIENGKIDKIKVNGTEQPITNKEVDIPVPVNVSDLDNDKKYQTESEVETSINEALVGALKPKGSCAFAELPTLSAAVLHNMYDVIDDFVTTGDFREGAGHNYPGGTNVAIINVGTDTAPVYKFDAMPGPIDLSLIYTKDETDALLDDKQDTLVSGTNIKTINGVSLLGNGDVTLDIPSQVISEGGMKIEFEGGDLSTKIFKSTQQSKDVLIFQGVDRSGATPVTQSLAVPSYIAMEEFLATGLETKQDILVSGTNIKTINGDSVLGSGNLEFNEGKIDKIKANGIEQTITNKEVNLNIPQYSANSNAFAAYDDGAEFNLQPSTNGIAATWAEGATSVEKELVDKSYVDSALGNVGDVKLTGATGGGNANIDLRKDSTNYINFERIWTSSSGEEVIRVKMRAGTSLATYDLYTKPTVDTLLTNKPHISIDSNSSTGNKTWAHFTSNPYGNPATTKYMTIKETDNGISVLATDMTEKEIASIAYVDGKTAQATADTLGTLKLNPSESITLNSNGQLDVGGRLGQMSNSTGIYSPKTINPAAVGNGSFLLTEGSGLKLGNKSLAVVTGTGLSLKTAAAAGSTTYTVNNTYENRIICAGIVGGVLALNEATAAQNYVNITSVTIGGYAPSVSNYWTATGDITIKTDASINPTSSTSSVRPYATGEAGFSNLFVGQLSGGKGGASIVVGQKVFSYSGNACAIVGASMYNTGNGNALFGRQHISKKNRSFLAGTGHDTTNGPSEGIAAFGMWSDIKSDTSFAIGNGTDSNNRSNSFEVDTNGDTFLNGYLVLKAPNGTQYKISVDNSGNLVTATL